MVFDHWPCLASSAIRILSRISAAARSVNVTATMRSGSIPRSRSSRYTSTSLRVLPVPALAQTTVLTSIQTTEPPVFAVHTALPVGGIGMHHSFSNLVHQTFDPHSNIVENRLIDRIRDHRISRRPKQQVPAFHSQAFIGPESTQRQICVDRNLTRLI